MNYKPLPDSLTIKKSNIQGLGLFALDNIPKDTNLGITHLFITKDIDALIVRTPLGGFINHSDTPNCKKVEVNQEWHLKTLIDIKKNEELTLKYTMYNPEL